MDYLDKIVARVLIDTSTQYNTSTLAKKNLAQYIETQHSYLRRYDHHQGTQISEDDLTIRFLKETAILHVATEILRTIVDQNIHRSFCWPVESEDSLYSWYDISAEEHNAICEIANQLGTLNSPQITLIDLCDQLLTKTEKRYIGEFYTPPSIVNHLIKSAKFSPEKFLQGNHIVDPACGGGMILASIASKVIQYAIQSSYTNQSIINAINHQLHGFDIQPFAITLCRTILLSIISPYIHASDDASELLSNIELIDPLKNFDRFWTKPIYSYVIGNPPFMSVKRVSLDFIEAYDEVIYGHPNLYILFLWWAVKASKKGGIISLLLPQSMLIGNYFQRLRYHLNETTTLVDITRLIDRKGVVGTADQQMMTVCLRVGTKQNKGNNVVLRVTRNGTDIREAIPFTVSPEKIVRKLDSSIIWVVSESKIDYEIEEALQQNTKYLGDLNCFHLGNGGYVWNQNKELLSFNEQVDHIPLVSAASISSFDFEFPYRGSHSSKERPFSLITQKVSPLIKTGTMILIQRTTPRKVGRRLVCAIPDETFLTKYPRVFLENHVNYISQSDSLSTSLYGLLAWLNSDLINFIFQLRNGTTQVSIYELKLLPLREDLLPLISHFAQEASIPSGPREKIIQEMNEYIFQALGLSVKHLHRVKEVLQRKENGYL